MREALSRRANCFQNEVYNLVYAVKLAWIALSQQVILDILFDDLLINAVCAARFLSLPFPAALPLRPSPKGGI